MSEHLMATSPTHHAAGNVGDVIAWMDHEASLLEILAYRLDGLANVLRSRRHSMVCTAASDVDTVHDQLMRAAVHRDLALLPFSANGADLPSAGELADAADEHELSSLEAVRQRIDRAVGDVERARIDCASVADVYRPGQPV